MLRQKIILIITALSLVMPVWGNLLFNRYAIRDQCDSLFLSNGSGYSVKNLTMTEDEVTFSFCDDTTNYRHVIPWLQVRKIKRFEGGIQYPPKPYVQAADDPLANQVTKLLVWSALSIPLLLIGVGFFVGIVQFVKGKVLLQKIMGHPKEAFLRKRIKIALFLSGIAWILPVIYALVGFVVLIKLFADLSHR